MSSLTLVKLGRLLSQNYAHAKIAEDLFPSTTDRLIRTDSLQVARELSPLRSVTFPINSREPGLPVNISEILWRNPTNPVGNR